MIELAERRAGIDRDRIGGYFRHNRLPRHAQRLNRIGGAIDRHLQAAGVVGRVIVFRWIKAGRQLTGRRDLGAIGIGNYGVQAFAQRHSTGFRIDIGHRPIVGQGVGHMVFFDGKTDRFGKVQLGFLAGRHGAGVKMGLGIDAPDQSAIEYRLSGLRMRWVQTHQGG